MPFSYYHAPDAPAPDYGAVVHARLGRQQNQQAAINALLQLAEENQRLKASKEQHAASLAQDQAQLQETTRFHDKSLEMDQAQLDLATRKEEDVMQVAEENRDAATQRSMMAQAGLFIRNLRSEQARNERAQMENAARAQAAEAHRQEAIKKLEQAQKRNEAMSGAMNALSAAPAQFEEHTFTAAELSPFYSPDPARMIASIKGSKFLAGKDETAEDVYQKMLKTKIPVRVAPEGWFGKTIGPFAADLTPDDQMALAKYSHGEDLVPYASNSAEARSRAFDAFKGHSEFGQLFGGGGSQAAPQKLPVDRKAAFQEKLVKSTYDANAKTIAMFRAAGKLSPDQEESIKQLEAQNKEIEDAYGKAPGSEGGASGQSEEAKIDALIQAHPDWTPEQIQDALNGK